MLFVKNTPVDEILTMKEMIEVVEAALKEIALGAGLTCRDGAFTIPMA